MSRPKPCEIRSVFPIRNIHRTGILINQAEFSFRLLKHAASFQIQNLLLIQHIISPLHEKPLKISLNRLPRVDFRVFFHGFYRRFPLLHNSSGNSAFHLKNMHDALLRVSPSLAVAASRRLQNAVQPRHFAPYGREIDIDARLDQAGRNHTADFSFLKPFPDDLQRPFSVFGNHQRRQMKSAFLRQHLVNLPCAFSRIDDAEGLLCFHQPCRQFFLRQDAFLHERNPLKKFKQLIRIGHDFPLNQCRCKLLE